MYITVVVASDGASLLQAEGTGTRLAVLAVAARGAAVGRRRRRRVDRREEDDRLAAGRQGPRQRRQRASSLPGRLILGYYIDKIIQASFNVIGRI